MRISEPAGSLLSITAQELEQWQVLLGVGMPVILIVIAIYLLVKNAEQVVLLLGKLSEFIRRVVLQAMKTGTEREIRDLIVKANKRLKIDNEDAFLVDDLKIDWAKGENARAYIDDDHVIIRMRSSSDPAKNFVNAVTLYVSTGLLTKVRRYFSPEVVRAMSMLSARNIVIYGDGNALEYFDNTVLRPILDESPQIKRIFEMLSTIDSYGMFYSILLGEYSRAGRKVYPKLSDAQFTKEADGLLRFLYQVAAGRGFRAEELSYQSFYFTVRIVMTVNFKATEDFIRCGRLIREWIGKEAGTVYVLASAGDEQGVRDALRHTRETAEKKLVVAEHVCKRGMEMDASCYHCFEVRGEEKAVFAGEGTPPRHGRIYRYGNTA